MLPAAANFPDAFVRLRPVVANPVDETTKIDPGVVADGRAVLVEQVRGIHELAINIELQLIVSAVADTHGTRAAVAVEMWQLLFFQIDAAVDRVHELERA